MPQTFTANDLLVTEGILTSGFEETLSQALAKLKSSHDAVFVVDRSEKLIGVISPYYAMYQSNYPPTAKVGNCLFHPPKLSTSTPIWEIARNMVQSKVYFLPVFADDGRWIGICSVRRLMQAVLEDPELARSLEVRTRPTRMITIAGDSSIDEARALLRNGGVSRLPVIDARGKLIGILTRYDLREALVSPRSSLPFHSRIGEKHKLFDRPIHAYFKRQVVTAGEKTPLTQTISEMLEKRIGSVVIVNAKWQPINILSYRDILEAIANTHVSEQTSLTLTAPEDFPDRLEAETIAAKRFKKLYLWGKVQRVGVTIEAKRNREKGISQYDIAVRTQHTRLGVTMGEASSYDWKAALNKAIDKVEVQIRKRDAS